jgi:hypothetical protein
MPGNWITYRIGQKGRWTALCYLCKHKKRDYTEQRLARNYIVDHMSEKHGEGPTD